MLGMVSPYCSENNLKGSGSLGARYCTPPKSWCSGCHGSSSCYCLGPVSGSCAAIASSYQPVTSSASTLEHRWGYAWCACLNWFVSSLRKLASHWNTVGRFLCFYCVGSAALTDWPSGGGHPPSRISDWGARRSWLHLPYGLGLRRWADLNYGPCGSFCALTS